LELLEEGWLVSSVQLGATQIRSGALLQALFQRDALRGAMLEGCPALLRVPAEQLKRDLGELVRGTSEDDRPRVHPPEPAIARPPGTDAPAARPRGEGGAYKPGGALEQYTIDLTAQARGGRIDPIAGRDAEIRQIVDILMRRRQNNPILTGDAGV